MTYYDISFNTWGKSIPSNVVNMRRDIRMPIIGLNCPISLRIIFYAFHYSQCMENCRPALMSIQTSQSTHFSTTALPTWQWWHCNLNLCYRDTKITGYYGKKTCCKLATTTPLQPVSTLENNFNTCIHNYNVSTQGDTIYPPEWAVCDKA
jgi:hypothetical protein